MADSHFEYFKNARFQDNALWFLATHGWRTAPSILYVLCREQITLSFMRVVYVTACETLMFQGFTLRFER